MTSLREYYEKWAEPARRAYAGGAALQLPSGYAAAEAILVCGMGGSGAAGDYVAAASRLYGGLPVYVHKSAGAPSWVDRRSLVYAVSFSGNTRETLDCAKRAWERGAPVVAVTTGGRLAEWARSTGAPLAIVEDAPAPRAGWPQLFYTMLGSMLAEGLLHVPRSIVEESLAVLEDREPAAAAAGELASWTRGAQLPVLVVPEPLAPVAVRARNEFAENTKKLVIASVLPEAGHNELEAWAAASTPLEFIVFDPGVDPWRRLLEESLAQANPASLHRLSVKGGSWLAKMTWATWVVGLASIIAAEEQGIDPEKLSAVKAFRKVVEATGWGD